MIDLARMETEAKERLASFVNRSGAQHLRAWRQRWAPRPRIEPDEIRAGLLEVQKILRDGASPCRP